jgi:hypothetical protein
MGFHAFKRFRKTRLRGARCLEDLNNFWMSHKPKTTCTVANAPAMTLASAF